MHKRESVCIPASINNNKIIDINNNKNSMNNVNNKIYIRNINDPAC